MRHLNNLRLIRGISKFRFLQEIFCCFRKFQKMFPIIRPIRMRQMHTDVAINHEREQGKIQFIMMYINFFSLKLMTLFVLNGNWVL